MLDNLQSFDGHFFPRILLLFVINQKGRGYIRYFLEFLVSYSYYPYIASSLFEITLKFTNKAWQFLSTDMLVTNHCILTGTNKADKLRNFRELIKFSKMRSLTQYCHKQSQISEIKQKGCQIH